MKTIWKYVLDADNGAIEMPLGSKILKTATQGTEICIWAFIEDPEADKEIRKFAVYGTGHLIADKDQEYIGTVHMEVEGAPLVFHVFEIACF